MVDEIRDDADNEITRIVRRPGPANLPVNIARAAGAAPATPGTPSQAQGAPQPAAKPPQTAPDEPMLAAPSRGPAAANANDSAPPVAPPVALDRQRPDRPQMTLPQMMPPRAVTPQATPSPSLGPKPPQVSPHMAGPEPIVVRPTPPQQALQPEARSAPMPDVAAPHQLEPAKAAAPRAPERAPAKPSALDPIEPVVGWLVIVKGPGRGVARQIVTGRNGIGSAAGQDIQLDFGDAAIAPQGHAYIVYDDEAREFVVEDGKQKIVVRLNGKLLTETMPIGHGDELRIGATTLRFVALCGADFDWGEEENSVDAVRPVETSAEVVVVVAQP